MQSPQHTTGSAVAVTLMPPDWVDKHADYLYSYALGRLGDEQEARDIVQETFLAALEGIAGFGGKSSERTWLTAIMRHKIVDRYRKRSQAVTLNTKPDMVEDAYHFFNADDGHWKKEYQPEEFSRDAADPLLAKEFNEVLRRCLHRLPALWISVFTMKHLEDADSKQICKELRLSDSNFWVIIHRAKLNLRRCLEKNWL